MRTRKELIVYFELEEDCTMSSLNWSYDPKFIHKPALMRAEDYDRLPFRRAAVSVGFFHEFPEGTLFVCEASELTHLMHRHGICVKAAAYYLDGGIGQGVAAFSASAVYTRSKGASKVNN